MNFYVQCPMSYKKKKMTYLPLFDYRYFIFLTLIIHFLILDLSQLFQKKIIRKYKHYEKYIVLYILFCTSLT